MWLNIAIYSFILHKITMHILKYMYIYSVCYKAVVHATAATVLAVHKSITFVCFVHDHYPVSGKHAGINGTYEVRSARGWSCFKVFRVMSSTVSKDRYSLIEQSNTLIEQSSISMSQLNTFMKCSTRV